MSALAKVDHLSAMCRSLLTILFCSIGMFGIAVSAERAVPSQGSPDEQAIWNLERAYWRYVENNDLTAYRALWHQDFLG